MKIRNRQLQYILYMDHEDSPINQFPQLLDVSEDSPAFFHSHSSPEQQPNHTRHGQPSKSSKSNRQVSSRNNLLKNLMKLLRVWVKCQQFPKEAPPLAFRLWETLRREEKSNRTLISVGLGDKEVKEESLQKVMELFNIQQKITPKELGIAQQFLREEIIRQLNNANTGYIVKNRRIKNKEEFQQFLNQFLRGLSRGQLILKMPKK